MPRRRTATPSRARGVTIPPEMAPDRIFHHGKVVTVDKDFSLAEAVAIKDGKFIAVGKNAAVRRLAGRKTEMVDLGGKTVIPGIIDSHIHAFAYGLRAFKQLYFETGEIYTRERVLQIIKDRVARTPPGEWIVARGPDSLDFFKDGRLPNRWELDPVTPNNPLYWNVHGHVGQVNSYGLRLAGITRDTPAPKGGIIGRRADGEPTGLLLEGSAHAPVTRLLPQYTFNEKLEAVKRGAQRFAEVGITSVMSPGEDKANFPVLIELWRRKELVVRWYQLIWFRPTEYGGKSSEEIEAGVRNLGPAMGFGDEWLRLGGIKLALDGGIEGTYTREPYTEEAQSQFGRSWHGMLVWDVKDFKNILRAAAKNDVRMFVHQLGDLALDITLDTMEEVHKEYPLVGKRWSLEHAGILPTKRNLEQAKRLGLQASTQQPMGWSIGLSFKKNWGERQGSNFAPNKTWSKAGVIVKAGSDAAPFDPMFGIWTYVTRKDLNGVVSDPAEKVTRKEALRFYTINGAYGTFEEDIKGSIEVGKLADMVVLSDDLLTVPADKIKGIKVEMTVIGGKTVFERKA